MLSDQNINPILNSIEANPVTKEMMSIHGNVGNLGEMEEALLLAAAFLQDGKTRIVVKKNKYEAQQLYRRLAMLLQEVVLFVMDESLRLQAIAASPEEREGQLSALVQMRQDFPKIIITNTAAYTRFLPDVNYFDESCLTIRTGQTLSRKALIEHLLCIGYAHVNYAQTPGSFASRGGILDVYSLNYPDPIRIEFFDTEIDSIRFFNPDTQRTIRATDEAVLVPASDILFSDEQIEKLKEILPVKLEEQLKRTDPAGQEFLRDAIEKDLEAIETHDPQPHLYRYYAWLDSASVLDYAPDAMTVFSTVEGVEENAKKTVQDNVQFMQEEVEDFHALPRYILFHDLYKLEKKSEPLKIHTFLDHDHPVQSGIENIDAPGLNYRQWVLEEARKDNVYFALEREDVDLLKEKIDISSLKLTDPIFYQGFRTPDYMVYTRREIFSHLNRKVPYQKTFSRSNALNNIMELEAGDYIVHAEYGIGQYIGVETREQNGVKQDYLHVMYRGNENLFVPLSQFQLIRKYVSKDGAVKLSKLGTGEWEKTKKKVNQKVEEIAGRLVELYAARTEDIGFAFPKDDALEREFDESFEYESTPDQLQATAEIKAEMEKAKPMDHLLIGDVGYGKTEVAMRCAYKAICAGKQVAFLCPTTILSMQHYQTLLKRFEPTGARIALVNRFISTKEMKKIREDLANGQIDIVVGTHRLLSNTVSFKDLGFLIIDEEQRFGVRHKEKIKEMKNSIDVLALSATPIPRTLQMSLIGVRTISQLTTPPAHRHPIQTYVMEERGPVVEEIIQRELSRSGQVFFLHNRVEDIYLKAHELQQKFPDISIGVAHGKMSREQIEDVMAEFARGKYQVLVCTTIIETGLDIANANTIIIENADRFGLAQLYQIRGRVGRREKLAYCYLLVTPDKQLSEESTKRLKSIKEFTQLGSGYKIAMRDLTIRGAGDMLGPKQAGFIDSVGLDLYLDMLSDAIARKKAGAGQPVDEELKEAEETAEADSARSANVQIHGYIPEKFSDNDGDKLALYQEIRAIRTEKELEDFEFRTADLFGKIPKEVQALFDAKRLDLFASRPGVDEVSEQNSRIQIVMSASWSRNEDGLKLFEAMNALSKEIALTFKNGRIQVSLPKKKNYMAQLKQVISVLSDPLFRKG